MHLSQGQRFARHIYVGKIPNLLHEYHNRGPQSSVVPNTAAEVLAACQEEDLDVELIDPRTVKPLDEEIILESVKKTGRLLAVDYDFPFAGFASEVCAMVAEKGFRYLKDPVSRITFPESSMPASGILERAFHPSAAKIAVRIKEILSASVPTGT